MTTPDELLRVVTEVREMRALCSGCGAPVGVDFWRARSAARVGRRLPALRAGAATGVEVLPVLRAQHDGAAAGQTSEEPGERTAARAAAR